MTHRRLPKSVVQQATRHLKRVDPVMKKLIALAGPCELKTEKDRFRTLVRSIVAQQISTAAARSIMAKLEARLPGDRISPAAFFKITFDDLRSVGLSGQKTEYLLDLAGHVLDNSLPVHNLGRYSDERVIELLTDIRGIGVWTAQMFLIFSLGRPDVFAPDDLGLRAAIGNLYGYEERPGKSECNAIAESWSPFRSIASWYLWRSFEPHVKAEWNDD
ncbi:MAG TPA: DNA-3-methyladenine glycosylase [Planctomycetaceae bacterium]|nr:DNA-3-methyladenine glycosylase [Planctomycetaceae bacterium]